MVPKTKKAAVVSKFGKPLTIENITVKQLKVVACLDISKPVY